MHGSPEMTGPSGIPPHIHRPANGRGVGDGNTPAHRVSGPVNPPPNLSMLRDDDTPPTPINRRTAHPANGQPTPGLGNGNPVPTPAPGPTLVQNDLDDMTEDQLKTRQKEHLEKASKISERYELHSLLGRAEGALSDPRNAPKDLKITVALPGEDAITLIPWSKELEDREDIADLMAIAKKVLSECREDKYSSYDAEMDYNLLGMYKNSVQEIAEKLHDNKYEVGDRDHDNEWEKLWKEMRHKPVRLEAWERLNRGEKPRVVVNGQATEKK